jgi:hypothetical protein
MSISRRVFRRLPPVFAALTLLATASLATADGLTLPPTDEALTFVAPKPDHPNYALRVELFVNATVPEPFRSAYSEELGLPTSRPATDPNNPNFIYQRFENGVLFHNATTDTTEPLEV